MFKKQQKVSINHSGFQVRIPASERILRTSIQILPAHAPGEIVTPFPGEWQAVWDTGAQSTLISNTLAEKLQLPIIGEQVMCGIGGLCSAHEYFAGLLLPNNVIISNISLYGFIGGENLDMLIGMDIISQGDFLGSVCIKFLALKLKRVFPE